MVQNINGYLLDADNVFVESRKKPICDVPEIGIGNKPIDGGNYLFTKEEMDKFLKIEPAAEKWFRPWYGAQEFIRGDIWGMDNKRSLGDGYGFSLKRLFESWPEETLFIHPVKLSEWKN